jgi:hypothetical protein
VNWRRLKTAALRKLSYFNDLQPILLYNAHLLRGSAEILAAATIIAIQSSLAGVNTGFCTTRVSQPFRRRAHIDSAAVHWDWVISC